MATYFGEILPVLSRATDDEEELENEINGADIRDEWEVVARWGALIRKEIASSPTNKISCNLLIFAVGPVACGFLQKHCIHDDDKPVGVLVCGFKETDRNTLSQRKVEDSSCFIHRIKTDDTSALVILWHHKASPVQQYSVTQKVFQYLQTENLRVVVLSTTQVSKFRSSNKEAQAVPFLRALATDVEEEEFAIIPKLEIPNIIIDLPANVLSYCQLHNIPATLFVGFIEVTSADSINLQVFQPLLDVPTLRSFLQKTVADLKPISSVDADRGNLYL